MFTIWRIPPLLLFFVFAIVQTSLAGWKKNTISDGGYYNSIAVDLSGRPHISYLDDSKPRNYVLRHAFLAGKSWRSEIVDSGGVGWYNSIAIDSVGQIHISYHADDPSSALKYAHFNGTAWSTTTVDTSGGWSTSIAVDSLNLPHIAYVGSSDQVKYAKFNGTDWIIETIPGASGSWDDRTSLALGSSDEANITFSEASNWQEIRLASNASGVWELVSVGHGIWPSLALDSTGHPHIVYWSMSPPEIVYTKRDGAGWSTESLTAGWEEPGHGEYPAIALDSQDRPHVGLAFYARNIGIDVTIYGRKTDAGWEFVVVDPWNGGPTSIALDQWGLPHLSYRMPAGASRSQLKYANSGISPPEITVRRLKNGRIGKKYNANLKAKKGEKPYTWQVSDGELPAGLVLDSFTGRISGIPSAPGTFEFEVLLTDSWGLKRKASFTVLVQ